MIFFTKPDHYTRKFRSELMPILRPFIKDQPGYTDVDRIRDYGYWVHCIKLSDSAVGSDLAVLPMSWNFYRRTGDTIKALRFIEEARRKGLTVLTWCSGDFGVTPLDKDVHILRSSGYLKNRLPNQFALPVFIRDPLTANFDLTEPILRAKTASPVVGFCGLAYAPLYKSAYDALRTAVRNIKYYAGVSPNEPQDLYPAARLRMRVLSLVGSDQRITSNFIIRRAYRAGARTPDDRERTTREYYQNMIDSDYVICIRGRGNFSSRLYETMAMGRIPIIVDTDCVFPYDDLIDWKSLTVWIDYRELHTLPAKLMEFHAGLSEDAFTSLQQQIRRIWVERLSMHGYFATLIEKVQIGMPLTL